MARFVDGAGERRSCFAAVHAAVLASRAFARLDAVDGAVERARWWGDLCDLDSRRVAVDAVAFGCLLWATRLPSAAALADFRDNCAGWAFSEPRLCTIGLGLVILAVRFTRRARWRLRRMGTCSVATLCAARESAKGTAMVGIVATTAVRAACVSAAKASSTLTVASAARRWQPRWRNRPGMSTQRNRRGAKRWRGQSQQ